jgi:hypothetical protein
MFLTYYIYVLLVLCSFYLTFPNFEKYVTALDGPKCLNSKGYHVRCRGITVLKRLQFFLSQKERHPENNTTSPEHPKIHSLLGATETKHENFLSRGFVTSFILSV